MNSSEQVALGTTLAGTNQFKILSAVMSQMRVAQEAYTQALESSGTTMQQNEKYMEGLEAKTNLLKAELEKLVLGEGGLQNFAKTLVEITTGVLSFVNNLGGLNTVLITLVGILTTINIESITTFIVSMPSMLGALIAKLRAYVIALASAITGNKELTYALAMEGVTVNSLQIAFGSLFAVIAGGYLIYSKYKQAQEKSRQEAEEAINAYFNYEKQLYSTIEQIDKENVSKSELLQINKQLNESYDEEEGNLKSIIQLRQDAIQEMYNEAQAKALETQLSTVAEYTKALDYFTEEYTISFGIFDKTFNSIGDAFNYVSTELKNLNDKVASGEELTDVEQTKLNQLQDEYNKLSSAISKNQAIIDSYEKATSILSMSVDEWIFSMRNAIATENYLTEANFDLETELEEIQEIVSQLYTVIDDLQSSYDILSDAVEQYNENGFYTIDTLQKLLTLSPQWLNMLEEEDGKLRINSQLLLDQESSVKTLIKAQAEEAKQTVYATAIEQLHELQKRKALGVLYEETQATENNTIALSKNTEQAYLNAVAKSYQMGITAEEINKVRKNVTDSVKAIEEAVKKLNVSFADNTAVTKKTTTAVNELNKSLQNTKTILENVIKTLQDDISEYKTAINYINNQIDKKIDKVKEAKEAEIESIEKQIEEIEKLSDAEQEDFDTQIDNLEKVKDIRDDIINEQIDRLEELKDIEKAYWDDKITALKEQNNELKDQLEYEKLLENLAKAKSTKVKVYREGQGFVYETDAEAVSNAQKQIDEYNATKRYEKELALLEKSRDDKVSSYEQQIKDMKDFRTKTKAEFENQISDLKSMKENAKKVRDEEIQNLKDYKQVREEYYDYQTEQLEQYKEQFKEQVDAYEEEQGKLLASQLFGINTEEANWETRLGNLGEFVEKYHEKLKQLEEYQKQLSNVETQISEVSTSTSTTPTTTVTTTTTPITTTTTTAQLDDDKDKNKKVEKATKYKYNGVYYDTKKQAQNALDADIQEAMNKYPIGSKERKQELDRLNNVKIVATKNYASGVASVTGSQIAITGEDPNKEIVLGSKANGTLTRIDNGGGVVNAKSTKTLAGLLNQIGSYALNSFNTPNQSNNSLSSSNDTVFNISSINVQANNADDFVRSMTQFKMQMTQRAYSV